MGQVNAIRIQIQEGAYTLKSEDLARALLELDMRVTGANCHMTATYNVDNLVDVIEYFSDPGLTQKVMRKEFSYSAGASGFDVLTGTVAIYYNDDATEDSRVTTTITRPNLGTEDRIESCDSPFTTSESEKL
jgi:hypothetical protein